jgi:hypothetical protein
MNRVIYLGLFALLAAAGTASAQVPVPEDDAPKLGPEVQADVGLAVIGLGLSMPAGEHLEVMAEVQTTGTYFLPWFDAGYSVLGFGGQIRATWFSRTGGQGLYITPWLRVDSVKGSRDDAQGHSSTGHAVGEATGVYIGWAFRLGHRVDVRLGVGPMYMRFEVPTNNGVAKVNTPFPSLDALIAYRL